MSSEGQNSNSFVNDEDQSYQSSIDDIQKINEDNNQIIIQFKEQFRSTKLQIKMPEQSLKNLFFHDYIKYLIKSKQIQEEIINIQSISKQDCIKDIQKLANRHQFIKNLTIQKRNFKLQNQNLKEEQQILCKCIEKLSKANFQSRVIASELRLSIKTLDNLKKYIQSKLIFRFVFYNNHKEWLLQFLDQGSMDQVSSMKKIYQQFILNFNIPKDKLTKNRFRKFLCRYSTYKQIRFLRLRQLKRDQQDKQLDYCKKWLFYKQQKISMIFIDETTFGHSWKNPKGWSIRGKCKYSQKLELKYQLCIIGAVGEGGFISYQIVQGIVNSEIFVVFLDQLLIQCQKFIKKLHMLQLWTTVKYIKQKLIQQIYGQRMKSLFLPPYSPNLNPIELVWAKLKRSIRQQEIRTTSRFIFSIQKILNNINESFIQKVINTQFNYLLDSLERIDFNL